MYPSSAIADLFALQVSIYMPPMKVVKNVTERLKNLSNFLVSGML